jgi:hypothetical protein
LKSARTRIVLDSVMGAASSATILPQDCGPNSRLVGKPYKCPISFCCRFHFDGNRVNQTLCQVGVGCLILRYSD